MIETEIKAALRASQIGGSHYTKLAIQPRDIIYANRLGWDEGNIVKLALRHQEKGGAMDVLKIADYALRILADQYGQHWTLAPVDSQANVDSASEVVAAL